MDRKTSRKLEVKEANFLLEETFPHPRGFWLPEYRQSSPTLQSLRFHRAVCHMTMEPGRKKIQFLEEIDHNISPKKTTHLFSTISDLSHVETAAAERV